MLILRIYRFFMADESFTDTKLLMNRILEFQSLFLIVFEKSHSKMTFVLR